MIRIYSDEYRKNDLAVREYKITIFGIPIYYAKYTSTNNEAVRNLTKIENKKVHICGFTRN